MPFAALLPWLWALLKANWKVVGPLVLIVAILGGTYLRGRSDMNSKWEARWASEQARILEERAKETQRQVAATEKLTKQYNDTKTEANQRMETLGNQLGDYIAENGNLTEQLRTCRAATDRDVERLRKLAAPTRRTPTPEPPKRPFWLR